MTVRLTLAALALALAAGCKPPPQTVEAFRQASRGGSRMGAMQAYVLPLSAEQVMRRVGPPSLRCYNAEYVRRGNAAAQDPGGVTLVHARVEGPEGGRTTIVVQVEHRPQPVGPGRDMPDGGFFQFVVDVESTGRAASRMTVHGPVAFGFRAVFDSFERWTREPSAPCPEWPGV